MMPFGTLQNPKQGAPTQNQDAFASKLQEAGVAEKLKIVENLVSEALIRTNGAVAGEASSAVEAAVRRARTKGTMLPHLDSGLVLSALDEVQTELSVLLDVTAANAEVMQEVATTAHQAEAPSERSMSTHTQAGEPIQGVSTTCQGSNTDPASVLTQVLGEDICGSTSELESTAGTANANSNVADAVSAVVAPLRHLASDAMADHASDPSFHLFKHSLRMRKARSGDLRVANAVDFDECASPRSSPRGKGTPKVQGHCIAFGRDTAGEPLKMEPLDKEVDQFSPMSPVCSAAREGRVRIEGHMSEDAAADEGNVHVLVVDEKQPEHQKQQQQQLAQREVGAKAASPRWMHTCESGAPPGLHPTAHVDHAGREGHGVVEPATHQSREALEVQLAEELGSGAPMAQLGDLVHDERWDLCDELKGRLDV